MARRIYLPRTMDAAAFSMSTYGIPLLVLATTSSAMLTGVAFALEWIPRLLAFAGAGAAVDKHGATRVFRVAATARALVVVLAAMALTLVTDTTVATIAVMALAATTGVLTEYSFIASETAGGVASKEAGKHEHRVQSVLLGIDQSATLAGPAAGALLLQYTGREGMLATIGALSLLAALFAPRTRRTPATQPTRTATVHQGLRTGWKTLRALPALGWLVTGLTLSNLATGMIQAAAPVIVVQQLGHSTASAGMIWSLAAVASLVAVTLCRFTLDRVGLWPVGVVWAVIASVASFTLPQADTYTTFMILIAVLMAGEGGMTVVLRTLRARLIPAEVYGATLSMTILIMLLPFPLAGVLVAVTPPAFLGHVLTGCAVLQTLGLTIAFARLRTAPALRPTPGPALAAC
ncbi:MFS transporter [Streptomyces sp. NPDC051561]|uniref:MFS transporter n=1 Tax=Streptomyces sp. NPDC051561 TaxID=3365658 RepID=UPI0037A796FA